MFLFTCCVCVERKNPADPPNGPPVATALPAEPEVAVRFPPSPLTTTQATEHNEKEGEAVPDAVAHTDPPSSDHIDSLGFDDDGDDDDFAAPDRV